jgi:trimethylamine---corrinoid protein Co-methyltransferase
MDCEVLQQIQRYFEPALVDTTTDAIARRGDRRGRPGGISSAAPIPRSATRPPSTAPSSDWRNFEAWRGRAPWTDERANRVWKAILAEFEPPPLDEGIREELAAFVARRKAEGGAPTDF